MVTFPLAPGHIALLNIDLQNCFVEAAPRGLDVLSRINELSALCRAVGIPVFQVRHALAPGTDPGVLGEIFPGVHDGFLDRDSTTAAFHPGLAVEPGDVLLDKPHFGAFHDTDLDAQLRRLGVDTVIVTGIETNICCETTAREAMVRDFRVLVMSDGTATGGVPGLTADEVQRASLATLALCFAQVATVTETAERIRAAYSA